MMSPEIHLAGNQDLPEIFAILNDAIRAGGQTARRTPVPEHRWAGWLAGHSPDSHPVWAATTNGNITGFAYLSPWRAGREALGGVAEISYFVAPGCRRRGIGAALMRHALAEGPGLGFHMYIAWLLEVNKPSIAILEKFGFSQMGLLPDAARYEGRTVGHLLLGLKL